MRSLVCGSGGGSRTPALEAAQVSRFHQPVTNCCEADEQRTRKRREQRIRALNEDAAVTGGWLRASKSPASEKRPVLARSAAFGYLANGTRSCSHATAVPLGHPGPYTRDPRRIDSGDDKGVLGARNRRHDVTRDDGLERGHDSRRTSPCRRCQSHPRCTSPHDHRPFARSTATPGRRRVNGDGMSRREDGVGYHRVDTKRTAPFEAVATQVASAIPEWKEHLPVTASETGRPGVNRERLSTPAALRGSDVDESPTPGEYSRAVSRCRHGSRRVRLVSVPTKQRAPNLREYNGSPRALIARLELSSLSRSVKSAWERASCPIRGEAQNGP